MIDALTRFQNERLDQYIKLEAAQAGQIDPPSPETLAAYFDDHKTQFRAPEYRKLSFVAITPEEIGKWSEVSDEDAKKAFELRRDKLGTPEKREVSQIVFPNADEALAARARITGGLSFDDLARSANSTHRTSISGWLPVRDPRSGRRRCSVRFRQATSKPASTGPIRRRVGQARQDRARRNALTYEGLASQIKKEIGTERARTKVAELHDKMEDERGGGASVIEAAQKLGLASVTVEAVDRSGRQPNGQPVTNIPRGLDVVAQAFNSDVGVDNDPIQCNGGYIGMMPAMPSREPHRRGQDRVRARSEGPDFGQAAHEGDRTVQLDNGGKLADEATALEQRSRPRPISAATTVPGVPSAAIGLPHRQGWGQSTPSAGGGSGSSSASPTSPCHRSTWPRLK